MKKCSEENKKAIQRFIDETDWDAFWNKVCESSSKEIDAYAYARAKSLEQVHVFI